MPPAQAAAVQVNSRPDQDSDSDFDSGVEYSDSEIDSDCGEEVIDAALQQFDL